MSNILDFVIRAKDLMSGHMPKVASAAQSSFGKVDRYVADTQKRILGLGNTAARMNAPFRQGASGAAKAISKIGAEATETNRKVGLLSRTMERTSKGSSLSIPYWLRTAAVAAGLATATLGVVKAGARAQQDLIGLSTFVGKQQAGQVYERIQKDAAATPFGTKGLLSANRALISTGLAADKARLDVLGLANAVAATGGGDDELSRMALNMQQVRNAGVATAVDIKQFAMAGINIYQLLANATGKTVKQVKDLKVSYDLLSYSLRKAGEAGGVYAGAMEAQSKSIFGKWSTLMDNIDIAMAKIGMSQSNAITGFIDQLIELTDRLPALAESWSTTITAIVKGVIDLTGKLISLAKWVYRNWDWLKYVAGVMGTVYIAAKALTFVTSIYNGVMAVAAMRTALFAAAETEAAVATTALNTAMLASPWGLAALAIGGVGIALAAVLSKTKELKTATEETIGAMDKYKSVPNVPGLKGGGIYDASYKNPLAGGRFIQDTSTFDLVTILDNINDTVGHLEKVYTGGKIWVPAAADTTTPPFVERLLANSKPMSLTDTVADATKNQTNTIKADYSGAAEQAGSGVTGGGRRVVNINFRNVVERMEVNGNNTSEVVQDMEPKLSEMIYRIFGGVPA